MNENAIFILIPIVTSLGLFAMVAVISIANAHSKKQRAQIHAEVQNRLIDKFGTAPEFIAFLSSPAGREFMSGIESKPRLAARDRILRGVRSATVLSCLGLAFCFLGILNSGWLIPGLILLALGGGYVLSSVLMVRLSRNWGLLDGEQPPPSTSSPSNSYSS